MDDNTFFVLIFALFCLTMLLGCSSPAIAQNDGVPARTWTKAFNLQHDTLIIGDSADAFTIPSGSVIERDYWCIDTTISGVDSVQLRAGESQFVLGSFRSTDGGDGAPYSDIQYRVPNHVFVKYEHLRIVLFVAEGKSGQIRLLIVYRELI